jgi:tetratricopeptide (TPR) repeat protein
MSHSQPPEPPTFGEDTPVADVLLRSLENNINPYPFSSDSVDPGPALLSSLFSVLSIEPPADVHSYAMHFPTPEAADYALPQHISSDQYHDLSSSPNNETGQEIVLRQPDRQMLNIAALQSASATPFNKICWYSSFEPSRLASQHTQKLPRLTQVAVANYEILELKERLSKLQGLFPETHPAMLAIVRGIASAFMGLSNWKLAEYWLRRVITISQRTKEDYSSKSLFDYQHLIRVILFRGRHKEAKELYEQLHHDTRRNASLIAGDSLAYESLITQTRIAQAMGSKEEAADYSHQLVQLNLTTVGPYDQDSLIAMNVAAESLMDQGNYDESLRLLCLMLQLQERCKQASNLGICIGFQNLALALLGQKHYKESVAIARRSVELAEELIGSEHCTTRHNMLVLARCLHAAGLSSESEVVYRDIMAKAGMFGEDKEPVTIIAMAELGDVIMESNIYEEANFWLEKALQEIGKKAAGHQDSLRWITADIAECYQKHGQYRAAATLYEQNIAKIHGTEVWNYDRCIYYCPRLGACYKKLEQYSDALALYKRAMREIRDMKGPYHSAIGQIQNWIELIYDQTSEAESEPVSDEDGAQ